MCEILPLKKYDSENSKFQGFIAKKKNLLLERNIVSLTSKIKLLEIAPSNSISHF